MLLWCNINAKRKPEQLSWMKWKDCLTKGAPHCVVKVKWTNRTNDRRRTPSEQASIRGLEKGQKRYAGFPYPLPILICNHIIKNPGIVILVLCWIPLKFCFNFCRVKILCDISLSLSYSLLEVLVQVCCCCCHVKISVVGDGLFLPSWAGSAGKIGWEKNVRIKAGRELWGTSCADAQVGSCEFICLLTFRDRQDGWVSFNFIRARRLWEKTKWLLSLRFQPHKRVQQFPGRTKAWQG